MRSLAREWKFTDQFVMTENWPDEVWMVIKKRWPEGTDGRMNNLFGQIDLIMDGRHREITGK